MSAPLADDVQTPPSAGSRCKGTKKNVYVQEKFIFIAIGYIFYSSFEGRVSSKVVKYFELNKN